MSYWQRALFDPYSAESLTYIFKEQSLGPAVIKISGTLSITGCEKKEWLREIAKRSSFVMAFHLLGEKEAWTPLIPLITKNIYLIFKENLNNQTASRTPKICERFHIPETTYFTNIFCIPCETEEYKTQVQHTVTLKTFDNKIIINDYTAQVECHVEKFRTFDNLIQIGFAPLGLVDDRWDRTCYYVMQKFYCPSVYMYLDEIFRYFMTDNKRMRKLLELKMNSPSNELEPNPEFTYSDFCACVTIYSRPIRTDYLLYD